MENPNEISLVEIARLEKRISAIEEMIVQLFRLYYDLAVNMAAKEYKEPPSCSQLVVSGPVSPGTGGCSCSED